MDGTKEIISRLKFVGRINKGEKLNTQYVFVQPDDMVTRLSRTFYNKDNRSKTLGFIRSTIDRTFEIIQALIISQDASDICTLNNMLIDLKQSKNGILNLKDTYSTDLKFCCDLDTIVQDIDAKLLKFSQNNGV